MGKARLVVPLGLSALALFLLLGVCRGPERPVLAVRDDPVWQTWETTHTIYLPVVGWKYDPNYVTPFSIAMYGNVTDTEGLQIMEAAGAKWVTTMLFWAEIEPTKGNYDWSSFDDKVRNAQAAGMQVYVLFTSNPSWAAELPGGPVSDTQALVSMVSQMAERYDCDGDGDASGSPCVYYWSFYGEPDNGNLDYARAGWGYWGHAGPGYAGMLAQVSQAIHTVNPRAKVLVGGLAYDWFEEDTPVPGPFVRSFLTDTLVALNGYPGGARKYIDAVAFHFYPNRPDRWPTIREKALEVRGIMERHGVDDLPLICPEMAYWSSPKFGSSEQRQAQWLVQTYMRGISESVQLLAWLPVYDAAEAGSTEDLYPDRTAGLFHLDHVTPKPSYYAYSTMTRELAWAHYVRLLRATGAEGYVFRMPSGREKTVFWATASTANVPFSYTCLRRVNTGGTVNEPIKDGDPTWDQDGAANGQIVLRAAQDTPLYVEPCH
jgi:hypothetical protein